MRQSSSLILTAALSLTLLAACDTTPHPDYRIKVMPSQNGKGTVAVPPECPAWSGTEENPFDNYPWPQFGCAQARNLAAQIDDPADLMQGRALGPADGTVSTAAIARYRAGKTTPFINPNASDPAQINKMEDSRVGGGSSK